MKQHLDSIKEREIDRHWRKRMILERISKLFLKKKLVKLHLFESNVYQLQSKV